MRESSPITVSYGSIDLNVIKDQQHTYLMPTKEVAKGYGVAPSNIRNQKIRHKDELTEGIHFISCATKSNAGKIPSRKFTYWTKLGVIYLGFFIKSERAKEFRKFAADLVLNKLESKNKDEFVIRRGQSAVDAFLESCHPGMREYMEPILRRDDAPISEEMRGPLPDAPKPDYSKYLGQSPERLRKLHYFIDQCTSPHLRDKIINKIYSDIADAYGRKEGEEILTLAEAAEATGKSMAELLREVSFGRLKPMVTTDDGLILLFKSDLLG
ncbi:hypothetical protein [Limisalsivibrio acetivorans]|uniref:hypothetical protein n=1 Tax=Limisalsivibrio acetivorans TaxID=1304888 RepID=UPI0003B5827E|nr:hypothetical protein [Limisalsivibrio acetivorans]